MSLKYLVASALLLGAASGVSAQSVKAGVDAWQHGDYAGAVANWRPLAESGDADAQFNLGQAYRWGRGVPTDLAAAKTWLERAAGQGHLQAETTLGLLLFENADQTEGLKWLKQAADKGEPRAQFIYGTALLNGDHVDQDAVLGYAYLSRAAAQGLPVAKDTVTQLDTILPVAQRKRGVALARELAPAKPASKSARKRAKAKQVETAEAATIEPEKKKAKVSAKPALDPEQKEAKASAKPAPESSPESDSWRIQLGAFSQRGSAQALYSKLSRKLAGHKPIYVAAGKVTRLQVGPYPSRAAAVAACSSLNGQACIPVPPK